MPGIIFTLLPGPTTSPSVFAYSPPPWRTRQRRGGVDVEERPQKKHVTGGTSWMVVVSLV